MPPLWLLKAGGVLALLAGVWLHGRHVGDEAVTEAWAAADRERDEADAAASAAQREQARAAAAQYEAKRAAIARRATQPSPESEYALHATICPPAGTFARPLELGDVPVPGAVLDRLRNAGADF